MSIRKVTDSTLVPEKAVLTVFYRIFR